MDEKEAKKLTMGKLKKACREHVYPLPIIHDWEWPGDPVKNFISELVGFDGKAVCFPTRDNAVEWLKKRLDSFPQPQKIYSRLKEIEGNVTDTDIADPHKANIVEIHISEFPLGVGEMGSLWVTGKTLGSPAAALFARDLFILVSASAIVPGLHDAYARLDLANMAVSSPALRLLRILKPCISRVLKAPSLSQLSSMMIL